jgi:osmotically inducible protein OsmC
MQTLYTTTAVATGDGRNGHVQSTDGILDADVRVPVELGGAGGATNPEQLFAAGYAACFHSAMKLVAGQLGGDTTDSEVVADVSLGMLGNGGFGLAVALEVSLPAMDAESAQVLVKAAHEVCPYSNAIRDNVQVALSLA